MLAASVEQTSQRGTLEPNDILTQVHTHPGFLITSTRPLQASLDWYSLSSQQLNQIQQGNSNVVGVLCVFTVQCTLTEGI